MKKLTKFHKWILTNICGREIVLNLIGQHRLIYFQLDMYYHHGFIGPYKNNRWIAKAYELVFDQDSDDYLGHFPAWKKSK